jgi:hypothetical protein
MRLVRGTEEYLREMQEDCKRQVRGYEEYVRGR